MSIKIGNVLKSEPNASQPKTKALNRGVKFGQIFGDVAKKGVNSSKIDLGTTSEKNPTVSHLLIGHPVYCHKCWDIIYSDVNKAKPYTNIDAGTHIFLDPETLTLSWDEPAKETNSSRGGQPKKNSLLAEGQYQKPSADNHTGDINRLLSQQVNRYIGRTYEEMNCYELLIKGLSDIGVAYKGHDGLQGKLIQMGLDKNGGKYIYLNGEGIVKALGDLVYTKRVNKNAPVDSELQTIMQDLNPLLKEGQILSFSTQSRGHTGVVSNDKGRWTFINSGILDHAIDDGGLKKGVGKESLRDEVRNWLRLSLRHGESLLISLGNLQEKKMSQFMQRPLRA